jgi:hypothetical protein
VQVVPLGAAVQFADPEATLITAAFCGGTFWPFTAASKTVTDFVPLEIDDVRRTPEVPGAGTVIVTLTVCGLESGAGVGGT